MRVLGVLFLSALVVLGLAGPAGAQTRRVHDPVDHDVPAYSDIRGLTVHDGRHVIRTVITLREVRPNKTSAYLVVGGPGDAAIFTIGTESSGHGHHRVFVGFDEEDTATKVRCRGARVHIRPRHHRVVVRFPQHCLGHPARRIQVAALTELPGSGSDADMTREIRVRRG